MKRLILTSSSGGQLARSGLAELVISSSFHFEWGPLPSPEKLAAYFAPRSANLGPGDHWSDWGIRWPKSIKDRKDWSFADFCEQYDVVELWFDPAPRDQLQLVCLLDHLSSCSSLVPKLRLRLVSSELTTAHGEDLAASEPHIHAVPVRAQEFETAQLAWSAYRAMTPEACVDLLHQDLSALLMLRPALLDLLAELPSPFTGLGATEMRLLELLARGLQTRMRCFTCARNGAHMCSENLNWVRCSRGSRSAPGP